MICGGARRIRPPRRRWIVNTSLILLVVIVVAAAIGLRHGSRVAAATTEDGVVPLVDDENDVEPLLPAPTVGECLVVPTSDEDSEESEDSSRIALPELPPVDPDGYLDTGFGEKQQVIIPGTTAVASLIRDRVERMRQYLHREVLPPSNDDDDDYNNRDHHNQRQQAALAEECLLRHAHCAYWATTGECENNPAYMTVQCAPVCSSCDQLLFDTRCPMQSEDLPPDIWKSGDLQKMFQRIVTDPYYVQELGYQPQVMLQPSGSDDDAPWVVLVDHFLNDDECDTLIQLGQERGYERSMDVGQKKFDGTYDSHLSTGRTSSNSWCLDACFEHPVTQNVLHKIENLTGIPDANSEYLQLLQYQENQFYEQHHDYIEFHLQRAQGVRIVTVFLYLNDVEEGGGTRFPKLNVTVLPKRGRALIWPSVLNDNPHRKDHRTDHEAMPVIKGIKYGANAWQHMRDFKTPFVKGCS